MMPGFLKRMSLLWKVLLSTSIITTLLLGIIAPSMNRYALKVTEADLELEMRESLREYEALFKMKVENLARLSLLLSTMSDVRAAFSTRDRATIRDTAGELWRRVSDQEAIFLVLDPRGEEIASLGGPTRRPLPFPAVFPALSAKFPEQNSSFWFDAGSLYYVILTPVYVQASSGPVLLNVLAAGFSIDNRLARELKRATPESEFAFTAGGRVVASTLAGYSGAVPSDAAKNRGSGRISVNGSEYERALSPLTDYQNREVGYLHVLRSSERIRQRSNELRRNIGVLWGLTLALGLWISYVLARRLIDPVKALDRAATEIANRNYDYRVAINHDDEFGRLSRTFNSMCDSIQQARDELISQERLNAVGHISSSIVHDLRNPLAAIYSGAEMLVDTAGLSEEQSRRLASNIFRASRRIQTLLTELTQGVGDRRDAPEPCILSEIIESAVDIVTPAAQAKGIRLAIQIPDQIEIVAARVRLQRVFLNLMNNAIEAMTDGGQLELTAMREPRSVVVHVDDSGPGLSEKVRKHLFRPFFSAGKRSGLGLGLALSRQTMLSMEGDLWASEKKGPGARFCVRIPIATSHTTEDHARTSEEHGLPRTPEFKLPK